ncbi:LysR family transcriptional regulator [Pseudomonas sp. MAFF212428]|uniref:LysR family transcriptional regulator n=1 Tax=Pseudomonas brassicae TaxID=2708063 RepID=A0A6B3NYB5_9PSED|nr:LysR family transcriptional regulator [Pseudomonas brassicae]NER60275.1 LysR family transcriptional regulator [Pseudomonas brassicae]NER65190.1 LysR family transcriptional regulator [Pseudomonas brassicae]
MPTLNFRHIEIFWAVMTSGSATGAAALLHTSQPTISRELARIESITQLTLFKRANARLIPTEQALMLFDEVKRAYFGLERITRAADAIRQHKQGQLALVCLPAFSQALLPGVCKHFLDLYPDVSISITPQDAPLLHEWLSSQRYDLGLIEDSVAPAGTQAHGLFSADTVCILPARHRLAAKALLTPEDFAGEDFISLAGDDPYRHQIDSLFEGRGISRRLRVQTHSAAAVCATVAQGVGIAIINPLTALTYAPLGLQIRRVSFSIPYTVSVVRPLHRPDSPLVDSFVQALQHHTLALHHQLQGLTACP